jgi:hypothetical protein
VCGAREEFNVGGKVACRAIDVSLDREAGTMALRLFERNLANVRTDLRSLYVRDAEHGYRLDLVDLDEHIGGLKRALASERELNKEIKANSGGTLDGLAAMSVFGVMPALTKTSRLQTCGPVCYHEKRRGRRVQRDEAISRPDVRWPRATSNIDSGSAPRLSNDAMSIAN